MECEDAKIMESRRRLARCAIFGYELSVQEGKQLYFIIPTIQSIPTTGKLRYSSQYSCPGNTETSKAVMIPATTEALSLRVKRQKC